MSKARQNEDEARKLIDLVADAMDNETTRANQYKVGRETLLGYYQEHPRAVFAVSQASKYMLTRIKVLAA